MFFNKHTNVDEVIAQLLEADALVDLIESIVSDVVEQVVDDRVEMELMDTQDLYGLELLDLDVQDMLRRLEDVEFAVTQSEEKNVESSHDFGIWVVVRQADTGEAEVYAAFSIETEADAIAVRIRTNEGPAYSAWVEYIELNLDPERMSVESVGPGDEPKEGDV